MGARAGVCGVVLLIALAACGKEPSAVSPTSSPTTSPSPSAEPGRARFVAYVDERDLWLYDVGADRVTRLTDDGDARVERAPEFMGETHVVFVTSSDEPGTSTISAIPLEGGTARDIVGEEGTILDFDLSPDGATIAYLEVNFDTGGVHTLKQVDAAGGDPSVLRTFGAPLGRGAGSDDETSVAWSPDGRSILVTDTHVTGLDPDALEAPRRTAAIFVLDGRGDDLVPPWLGTHARWWKGGGAILYRGFSFDGDDVAWHTLDVPSADRTTLDIRPRTLNLSLTPNGERVAYDTSWFGETSKPGSWDALVVYRFDLETGRERMLADGAIAPLWVSDDEALVTDAKRPGPRAETLNSWVPLGTVSRVTLDGTRTVVSMTSTWDAATLFER